MMDTIIGAEFMKGVQQGETRGRLAARREDLTSLLSKKFAANMDESFVQRIEAAENPDILRQWFEEALSAKSWKQFIKAANWPPSS